MKLYIALLTKGENRASILRAWCLAVVVDF